MFGPKKSLGRKRKCRRNFIFIEKKNFVKSFSSEKKYAKISLAEKKCPKKIFDKKNFDEKKIFTKKKFIIFFNYKKNQPKK